MSEKKPYLVQMTPKLGTGERATLVLRDTGRKVVFALEDKEAQELLLDAETAAQLANDGYDVSEKKAAPAGKPAKKSEE